MQGSQRAPAAKMTGLDAACQAWTSRQFMMDFRHNPRDADLLKILLHILTIITDIKISQNRWT
jgi:hypothetical protein